MAATGDRLTHCHRGHKFTKTNTAIKTRVRNGVTIVERGCRTCRRMNALKHYEAAYARKKARLAPSGLVPAGLTDRQLGGQKAWATRRIRYGDKGLPEAAVEKMSEASSRWHRLNSPQRRKTHCKHGHKLRQPTLRKKNGKFYWNRRCGMCTALGKKRDPVWAHDEEFYKTRTFLSKAMYGYHPDRWQANQAKWAHKMFINAQRKLETFIAAQTAWYKARGLALPSAKQHGRRRITADLGTAA